MKKKILSLILMFMLLPLASIFVACGKEENYNLNQLKSDFEQVEKQYNNVKIEDGKMSFVYTESVNNAIQTTAPYTYLKDYNYALNNLMSFTHEYIEICSDNSVTKDKALKNKIKNCIDDFDDSIKVMSTNIESFCAMVDIVEADDEEDITAEVCLIRYETLLVSYNDLYSSVTNLNNALSTLYFKHILNDTNPNVAEIQFDSFDASLVINKLKSKICYQISLLTENYIEMYVDTLLAEKIANSTATFDLNYKDYKSKVDAISKDFDEVSAAEYANAEANKQKFYNLAINAYNLQEMVFNDIEKFTTALNKINYISVKNDNTSSAYDKLCVNIIESNYELISNYNVVLVEMLALMGV